MNTKPPHEADPVLRLNPRRSALLAGHTNTVELLVRITAPPRPAGASQPRPPFNLALVLDRSGSMSGQPLTEACRCAHAMIQRLDARDRAALVVFDDQVNVLVTSRHVTDQRPFQAALGMVQEGGCTNLHGGWVEGAGEVARHLRPDSLNRIVLLSDGNANQGLCDPQEIARQCAELAGTGVTTSTYGLGNHFNEELMVGMAKAGMGNPYYSDTADDLLDKFEEEFALMQALCARRLRLLVRAAPGVKLELLNDYPSGGDGIWRLPDLAYDSEAWAVLRLNVSHQEIEGADERPLPLLEVELAWTDLEGQARSGVAATLALPVLPVAAFGAVAEDERVTARLAEIESAGLQLQARTAARQGDWDRVDRLLAKAKRLAQDHPWLEAVVSELEKLAAARDDARFSKESYYSSQRMSRRLSAPDESAREPDRDDDIPAFLRRQSRQGKKSKP